MEASYWSHLLIQIQELYISQKQQGRQVPVCMETGSTCCIQPAHHSKTHHLCSEVNIVGETYAW